MAIWRDSLYICGGIASIDGEPVRQVAQWIGGEAVGDCSTVGITEAAAHSGALQIVHLAGGAQWTLRFPQHSTWAVEVYDAMGRLVRCMHANGEAALLNLDAESKGIYLLRAVSGEGMVCSAKVVRR